MNKIFSKIQVGLLALCSAITSLLVILIIIFLFKEGFAFFNQRPVTDGFVMAVHPSNKIETISPEECKSIFDQEVSNWKQIGLADMPLELASLESIGGMYSEEQIGGEMEHLDSCYNDYVMSHEGALVSIPKTALTSNFKGKIINVEKNSISNFLSGREWFPTSQPVSLFGILPLLSGTFLVSIGAILFALPLGLACAIFMAEITTKRRRKIMKPLVEL